MNPLKFHYKINTIFMNSKNSKKPDPHRLLLNIPYKMNLNRNDVSSSLCRYHTWTNMVI